MPRTEAEPNPALWLALTAQVRAEESVCWLCGEDIDLTLPPRRSMSFSVDHKKSKLHFPELRYVRSNLRAAHHGCNSRKKDRDLDVVTIEPTSQSW